MTQKWYWPVIIVIVVLALAGYFFLGRKSSGPAPASNGSPTTMQTPPSSPAPAAPAPVATDQVSYDGTKYSPQFIMVKLGDTVTFKNDSSAGMWVASAPHPAHTDYPEFDAKKEYKPGESYTFTFTKAGTWKFHNHVNPTAFGSVTVK